MKRLGLLLLSISLTLALDGLQEFTTASNLFARTLYKEFVKTNPGNFLVSPFSAETILTFALSGCRGETAEELRNILNLSENQDEIESAIKYFLPKLKDSQYTLHTANKLYVKENFTINKEFKKSATEVYDAGLETIDFEQKVQAAKTMNSWVEQQTNNKIKNLINSNSLDEYTRAVLINALYFKANWTKPFRSTVTKKTDFYRTATDIVKVDTLRHFMKYFNYYECPHLKAQFLELPFQGEGASMVIVLPNEKEGLTSLENQLDQVFAPQHTLRRQYLNVALPKFKIESSIDFKKILTNLGVTKIFDDEEADLSGIAGEKGDLIINEVAQKTFINVKEEGVEAAAATYVLVRMPISGPFDTIKHFIANHPFIFYIKIKGLIIFAGRVTDPQS